MSHSEPRYRYAWVAVALVIVFCFLWSISPDQANRRVADATKPLETSEVVTGADSPDLKTEGPSEPAAMAGDKGETIRSEAVATEKVAEQPASVADTKEFDIAAVVNDETLQNDSAVTTERPVKSLDPTSKLSETTDAAKESLIAVEKKATEVAESAKERIAAETAKLKESVTAKIENIQADAVEKSSALSESITRRAESAKDTLLSAKQEAAKSIETVSEKASEHATKLKDNALATVKTVESEAADQASRLTKKTSEAIDAESKETSKVAEAAQQKTAASLAKLGKDAVAETRDMAVAAREKLTELAEESSETVKVAKAKVESNAESLNKRLRTAKKKLEDKTETLKDETLSKVKAVTSGDSEPSTSKIEASNTSAEKLAEKPKAKVEEQAKKTKAMTADISPEANASKMAADDTKKAAKDDTKTVAKVDTKTAAKDEPKTAAKDDTKIAAKDEPEATNDSDVNAPPVPTKRSAARTAKTTEVAESKRPWLGLRLDQTTPRIDSVYPGSGAAETEIQAGDVITGINDEKPLTTDEVVKIVTRMKASDTIKLIVQRGVEQLEFEVDLGKPRPKKTAAEPAK